uniref:DUF281 domain-containing protein n=1 Tax=Caenorhabditis tropicalis TaxID=1561998 RepID=A0A1I7TUQ5_9PELO
MSTPDDYYPTVPPAEMPTGSPATSTPMTRSPVTNAPVTNSPVTNTPIDPCTTCDISSLLPTNLPTGAKVDITELAAAGECKQTRVECARTDERYCVYIDIKVKVALYDLNGALSW